MDRPSDAFSQQNFFQKILKTKIFLFQNFIFRGKLNQNLEKIILVLGYFYPWA